MQRTFGSRLLTILGIIATTILVLDRLSSMIERMVRLYHWQDEFRQAHRLRHAVQHAEVGD